MANNLIKILFVSSSYPQHKKDWKSVFIQQLLNAISRKEIIDISFWGPPGNFSQSVRYSCLEPERIWLKELMQRGGIIHLVRQGGRGIFLPFKLLFLLRRLFKRSTECDVLHINWLQNAIPLIGIDMPVVISVLGSDFGLLKIPGMTSLIRHAIKKRRCIIAPNADWMVAPLNRKFGDLAEVKCISLGIEAEWYDVNSNITKELPRKWLAVTRLTKQKIGKLFEWGERHFIPEKGNELHLFGPMQEEVFIPDWIIYHGPTYPENLRERWFPLATGFVTLSEHDEGRPQIMLEAMAAGVPIIASRIPAHENFIKHQKTGWLTSSEADLEVAINWLSKFDNHKYVAQSACQWVTSEVGTWSDCADRYLDLYKKLLETT